MPRSLFTMLLVMLAGSAAAWEEPARGSATRGALMDAIRPIAEWKLGAPVQFVVHDLRREGNVAFAGLTAQRPGGGAIDPRQTPAVARGEEDGSFDISEIFVLYKKSGDTWVAVHYSFGATDAWWSWEPLCREYRAVTPGACAPFD
ncbi:MULTISPECIES: hypothetical protein [unclassified Roseovarius]|uniref:hypothetical protein n=1 Tax=unclassified Roseovarius TaxID=2614913 RepID=UPI00273E011E|nr:hypothetical protein [Roseovarius sp. MMSF_3350]